MAYICFEEFINKLNLLYISICLYLQKDKSYGMHELCSGPNFFLLGRVWYSEQRVDFLYSFMFLILVLFSLCTFDLRLF
jgi:hypothetical protein